MAADPDRLDIPASAAEGDGSPTAWLLPGERLYVLVDALGEHVGEAALRLASAGRYAQVFRIRAAGARVQAACVHCRDRDGEGTVCVTACTPERLASRHVPRRDVVALLASGDLRTLFGVPALDPRHDRVLIAGAASFIAPLAEMLSEWGLQAAAPHVPGHYAIVRLDGPRRG